MDEDKIAAIEQMAFDMFSICGKGVVNAFIEDTGHKDIGKRLIIEVENKDKVVFVHKIEEFHRKSATIVDYKFGWSVTAVKISEDSKITIIFILNKF
ncbi:hypothetical protein [Chryseobacterium sp. 5_R23647]|uniref:hypothetical protein n=1 Tax=Chryseobacterium sp. 5_R23647 TaxID=2258964 RepID=UPI000E247D26|nr:hypothetical protein [Chryseobacterium sp. 5_R23647]REC40524.1 hypothetical protein DRF69_18695 [Chryseobacterium sp. 5_R23647]